MKPLKYYDLFYNGHWVGMSRGETLDDAKQLTARSLPSIASEVKYAEWFGRNDPRNCKNSGGNEPNPS